MNNYKSYTITVRGSTLSGIVEKWKNNELIPDEYYEVDQSLTWQQVWDDPKNREPNYIRWDGYADRKNKSIAWIYIGERVWLPYIRKKIRLVIPHGIDINAAFFSGTTVEVKMPAFRILIDSHMHIQSLCTTPLPLQWSKIFLQVSAEGGAPERWAMLKGSDRRHMLNFATGNIDDDEWGADLPGVLRRSSGDYAEIAKYSSDLVAKLFMGKAVQGDFKRTLYWLFWETMGQYNIAEAEERGRLQGMTEAREIELQDFYMTAAYYYKECQVFQMNLIMPMDQSFAHYWGLHSLPIYLPDIRQTTFLFIDDFLLLNHEGWWDKEVIVADEMEPLSDDEFTHLSSDFPILEHLTNYCDYFRYLHEIEGYEDDDAIGAFDFSFDYERIDRFINAHEPEEPGLFARESTKQQYTRDLAAFKRDLDRLLTTIKDDFSSALDKKYIHFLETVPGDNTQMYEDYWEQLAFTEASAFRYPLQMIPFYHYDPRRYYHQEEMEDKIPDHIRDNHGFIFFQEQESPRLKKRRTQLLSVQSLEGRLGTDIHTYFQDILYNGIYADDPYNRTRFLRHRKLMQRHEDTLKNLTPDGPFLGVKVYPALGYPADLYKADHKGYYDIDDRYMNWDELFRHCADKGIPVTTHASPLGMTIGDGFNYVRCNEDDDGEISAMECALYLETHLCHPDRWRSVLEDHPELKINLAHFSGMARWEFPLGTSDPEDNHDWRQGVIDLINESRFPHVFTDISCYTMDKFPAAIERDAYNALLERCNPRERRLMEDLYDQYGFPASMVDNRFFLNWDLLRFRAEDDKDLLRTICRRENVIEHRIETIGAHLAGAIRDNERLRWRILMGTDWLMSELGLMGLGGYFLRMFEMLRFVTRELGDEWDAWHQFAVVNPLNFLGLLETDGQGDPVETTLHGKKVYTFLPERLEKMIEALEKKLSDSEWRDLSGLNHKEIENFPAEVLLRLNQIKATRIYTAEEIKTGDALLLTSS